MMFTFNNKIFSDFPVLESKRLIFRSFELTDSLAYMKLRSDPQVMEFVDAVYTTSYAEALLKIQQIIEDYRQQLGISWVITLKESDKMIGYIGFWRLIKDHLRAEIGFMLDTPYWRQGYMTEAAETIIDFGFKNMQLHSIEANVNEDNIACIALLRNLGFVKEAHFRENYLFKCRFLDSLVFSLLEPDFCKRRNDV